MVVATALPLSIIPTFGVMYFAGFTLNSISLLALALVIGILVDDAIVEVENIARHLRMGKSPRQAAIEASGEIGLAVLATTVTLVAVFLPTAFMGGISGKLFRQFGVTACAALLFSLLVARMLTPMMAAYLLRAQTHAAHDSRLMTRYLGWIHTSLSRRGTTIALVGVLLLGSLALIPLLPTSFLPAQDDARTTLSLELAPGSSLARSSNPRSRRRCAKCCAACPGYGSMSAATAVASVWTSCWPVTMGSCSNGPPRPSNRSYASSRASAT